jgi:UDP-glucose 4-epimerase
VRYLITGGAGFIGSHLSDELLARGHEVHVLDDLSTGSLENIRQLEDRDEFAYTIDSVANAEVVDELVRGVDAVYHLAAAVGVQLIVESPVRTIETNVRGTEVVLAQADRRKTPVFIASSSEVYGKSGDLPYREDGDLTLGPTSKGRWSYACSKMLDEFLAIAHWKERQLPTVIGRLFNTVGPRQTGRYGMVVPSFVGQAIAGRPITVYGDGNQRRCFCHVADVVRALADLMQRDDIYGEVFNIGSQHELRIKELAELVKQTTGSSSEIELVPYDEAYEEGFEDMQRRIPDTTRIKERIGWEPKKSIEEILADVIAEHGSVRA